MAPTKKNKTKQDVDTLIAAVRAETDPHLILAHAQDLTALRDHRALRPLYQKLGESTREYHRGEPSRQYLQDRLHLLLEETWPTQYQQLLEQDPGKSILLDATGDRDITRGEPIWSEGPFVFSDQVEVLDLSAHMVSTIERGSEFLLPITEINLDPLRNCPRLTTFSLRGNALSWVDLSPLAHCSSLRQLDLSDNNLTELDLTPLGRCPNLEALRLQKNEYPYLDLTPLFACPKLATLKCDAVKLLAVSELQRQTPHPPALHALRDQLLWRRLEPDDDPNP